MVLSGGLMIKDGLVQDPSGFSGALWNVTQRAEDFVTERNQVLRGMDSWGKSSFAFGDSSAAKMVAAGSGPMGKLALFASNAQSAMAAASQGPALPYDPIGEFMRMQVATPNFGAPLSKEQSSALLGAGSGSGSSLSIDGSKDSSKSKEITASSRKELAESVADKGYGEEDAKALVDMIEKKTDGDLAKAKKLISGLPSNKGDDWYKKFAEWYGTKIGGKDAKEVADGIEKDVYGKGAEIKLKRVEGDDRKESEKKGAPVTAEAFEVTQEGGGLSVGDKIFRDKSTGRWMKAKTDDDLTLVPIESLEGSDGSVSSSPATESTLKLKPDYRAGVKDMKVGEFMDHLDTKFSITRPGKKAAPAVAASSPGEAAPTTSAKMSDSEVAGIQHKMDAITASMFAVSGIDGDEHSCRIVVADDNKEDFKRVIEDTTTGPDAANVFKEIAYALTDSGKIVLNIGDKEVEIDKAMEADAILTALKGAVAS